MGNYRITINAVGGHGQDRQKGDGEVVDFAAYAYSPEEIVQRAVKELQASGNTVSEASVHHWPGSDYEVLDNLLTGKRTGSF